MARTLLEATAAAPAMLDERSAQPGALTGFRVLDLANDLAAYASRLFADLGADVIRIEPPGGSSSRREPPVVVDRGETVSLFDAFVNAGKRSVVLDLEQPAGRAELARLLGTADVLIETFSATAGDELGLNPADLASEHPRLVHVSVTPFGRDRSSEGVLDDDLTIMAAGGLLHLGGYADTEPIVAYGGQARNAASLFAAVGALVALLRRESTGRGDWVDVSAQECVAQALEDSVATFELTGQVRRRLGSDAREAGTGVYECADGLISMVAGRVGTAKAWRALVAWLVEAGVPGAEALQDERWTSIRYRQTAAAIEAFSAVFGAFARDRTRLELYRGAQARGIALSPVNEVSQLLDDEQLRARDFWVRTPVPGLGREAIFPGPPYRLSATPVQPAHVAPAVGADTAAITRELEPEVAAS
ncbi:MAG TPA: CoA transferase [Candidatus Limnocylindrales bacterium]|nr:CoA transferase [Candidatus Limnocylindrales bacterium]